MKKTVLVELELDYCAQCIYLCADWNEDEKPIKIRYTCGHVKGNTRVTNPKEGVPKWCPMEDREVWQTGTQKNDTDNRK